MDNFPLVSVIVPNYNHAAFLKERMDSILAQTYQNIEVILLDDASTDGSVSILQQYAKHPKVITVQINEVNSGSPFKQWQKGLLLAKGKYIWIAESDDVCAPAFLEKVLPFFNEKTVLVYSASININDKGEELGINSWAKKLSRKKWEEDYRNDGKNEILSFLRYRNTIPNASAVVFKRENIQKVQLPIDMYFCGDWHVWIELLKQGDIAFCSQPLNYFRRHDGTTRVSKLFLKEKIRMKEYSMITKANSSLLHRLNNRDKYEWIMREWTTKIKEFGIKKIFKLYMPIDFRLTLLYKSLFQ